MSSTWEPDGGHAASGGSWPPGLGPPLQYELAPEPASRRRGWRAGATGVAGVLVIATLGFAAVNLTSADGASSPEAAVEALFGAVDQEDAIGVVEALEPSERRLLTSTLEDLQAEGERLGLTDPDADLRGVQGVDLEVRDLQLRTEELADGVVAVALEGTVSSATDLRQLPFGPIIEDAIDRARTDDGQEFEDTATDEIDLAGGRLVTVRRGGGWHVSVMGSIAEAIRLDADDPSAFPDPADAIPAVGAPDPEAAVRQMIDAATGVDVRRMIELTDPEEAEVLHRYGPLFVDAADPDDGGGVTISDLTLQVADGPDGDKVVTATTFTMTSTSDEQVSRSVYADGCTEITWSYTDEYRQEVLDDMAEYGDEYGEEDTSWLDGDSYRVCRDDVAGPFGLLGAFESPGLLSMVVAEHDGQWYVRPAASIVESILSLVRGLDPEGLERTVRAWTGEYWLTADDEFWEACGVARPGDDVSRADGEAAYEQCYEQLPDDYEGAYPWFGPYAGSDEGDFETIGEPIEPLPEDACYSDAAFESDDPDAAILACLEGLAAEGKIDQATVDEFRCGLVYADVPYDEDMSEAELEAAYDAAEEEYRACLAGEEAPAVPTVTAPATTAPPVTTVPATTAPPATTTAPPATTVPGG